VRITPRFMREEALALFKMWRDRGGQPY